VPTDTYHYQLAVYTGVRKGAGTKSKPSFILSGDYADTGVRKLYDGKRQVDEQHSAILTLLSCKIQVILLVECGQRTIA